VEHCQIGVFLAYASARGPALLDRELSLPKEWPQDRERCTRAGIPVQRQFATKPALARDMLERAFQAGIPAAGVTGDSVYGDDRRLRLWLEAREHADVLAVSGKEYVWLGWPQRQVTTVLAAFPADGWTRRSAGAGAKGPRWYDWYWRPLAAPMPPARLAVGAAECECPDRPDRLCRLCSPRHPARRGGPNGRDTLDD
jgi:SRSO17 transposase